MKKLSTKLKSRAPVSLNMVIQLWKFKTILSKFDQPNHLANANQTQLIIKE